VARLAVLGAGAVGTVLAVRLAAAGHDVTVGLRQARHDPMRLSVEGFEPVSATLPTASADRLPVPLDGVAIAVKAYDLAEAARPLADRAGLPTLLVQNGLGVERLAASRWTAPGDDAGRPRLVRGVTSIPSTGKAEGVVRQVDRGFVVLDAAPSDELLGATEAWAGWLSSAGVEVRRGAPLEREVWRKLLVNAAINPVTADHGVENGRLLEEPWRGQALALLREALEVAERAGVRFDPTEAEHELFAAVRATSANRSSMLQDLDRGRETEIETISGAVVTLADRYGLDVPATRRALERIRGRREAARRAKPS
jgi:2-dehydropantoate 2-reductase